ncbi:MAG: hypothetical protein IAE90_07405 [Ignavibacteria bacterium]|nr:hypothetical protein [Ignavibacteria bacterium]
MKKLIFAAILTLFSTTIYSQDVLYSTSGSVTIAITGPIDSKIFDVTLNGVWSNIVIGFRVDTVSFISAIKIFSIMDEPDSLLLNNEGDTTASNLNPNNVLQTTVIALTGTEKTSSITEFSDGVLSGYALVDECPIRLLAFVSPTPDLIGIHEVTIDYTLKGRR